jgi:hypothetical protein
MDDTRMLVEYEIIEIFEITGRGAVAVIDGTTERSAGKPHRVEVLTPGGTTFAAEAHKEYLLRREPTPVEREAYLLKGLHRGDVPSGSRIRFIDAI